MARDGAIEFPLEDIHGTTIEEVRESASHMIQELRRRLRVPDFQLISTYEAGWSDGVPAVKFHKGPDHQLHIRGFATHAGPALPDAVFTLPVGCRPSEKLTFWHADHEIEVDIDGTVTLAAAPGFAASPGLNFTGISFLAGD